MTRGEVERQLRRVHPYRARARRRRRAMAPARRRVEAVLGLLMAVGLLVLLAVFQLVAQGPPNVTAGQSAAWGQSHKRALVTATDHTSHRRSSLFPERKRPYNPHYDPRSRRAQKARRHMFSY